MLFELEANRPIYRYPGPGLGWHVEPGKWEYWAGWEKITAEQFAEAQRMLLAGQWTDEVAVATLRGWGYDIPYVGP